MSKNDDAMLASLKAISDIELRDWPEASKPYHFSEEFVSDIARIKTFCKSRAVFGRSNQYIGDRWDTVVLLAPLYFLYYLPAILLAVIEAPKGNLAKAMVMTRLTDRSLNFSDQEQVAVDQVVRYLGLHGTTAEDQLRRVRNGRLLLEKLAESGQSDEL